MGCYNDRCRRPYYPDRHDLDDRGSYRPCRRCRSNWDRYDERPLSPDRGYYRGFPRIY